MKVFVLIGKNLKRRYRNLQLFTKDLNMILKEPKLSEKLKWKSYLEPTMDHPRKIYLILLINTK